MFKPMLATNTTFEDVRYPAMFSIKKEGVRGIFTPAGLRARSLKKFNNKLLQLYFSELTQYCIDNNVYVEGEFYRHGLDFSEISSITRRAGHPDTDKLEFHAFDFYSDKRPVQPFSSRYQEYYDIIFKLDNFDKYKVCYQVMMYQQKYAEMYYDDAMSEGFEGVCIKDPEGLYKFNRSTHKEGKFLRIKPDDTFDGQVIQIVERMENLVPSEKNELGMLTKRQDKDQKAPTGMAGVAIVNCENFPELVRVTLSKNLTDMDRRRIWENRESYEGKWLEFKGMEIKGMELPRAPRFLRWRDDLG